MTRRIEDRAENLVGDAGVTKPPVPVRRIARQLGLPIVEEDLGTDISALLVSDGTKSWIVVNGKHHKNRKRFSIAHEIAHHVLGHQLASGEKVHVDKRLYVAPRGPTASQGIDSTEIEANQFAAALLMPKQMVEAAVSEIDEVGLSPDDDIPKLAKLFQVSEQAMTIRLGRLGHISF